MLALSGRRAPSGSNISLTTPLQQHRQRFPAARWRVRLLRHTWPSILVLQSRDVLPARAKGTHTV
jgi:hypothetical protein